MQHTFSLVGGASLGAGIMFFLDPDRGTRRRAIVRDKGIRLSTKTREFAGSASRDVRSRAMGMGAAVKSWAQPEPLVPDNVLAQRIRAKLASCARHPSAIDVHVTEGSVVTLSGPVLEDEIHDIRTALQRVRGVTKIYNRMDRYATAEGVPALQGSTGTKRARAASMQSHWSSTARMAAAVMGSAAVLYGLRQRTVGATTLAASGLGLLVRSATNQEFAHLFDVKEQKQKAA